MENDDDEGNNLVLKFICGIFVFIITVIVLFYEVTKN